MANYLLNEELRRLVQDVVREHKNWSQPRPKRGRRQRKQVGGSTPTPEVNNFRAITTTTCPAATGIVGGNITPGTAFATLYVQPADQTIGGTAWTPGESVLFENWMFGSIPPKKPILLRKSRTNVTTGGILYEVIAEGCAAVPDSLGG